MEKGTKVRVNKNHHGAQGSTGRISGTRRIAGRTYYLVRLTGGRAAGFPMLFTAACLDIA